MLLRSPKNLHYPITVTELLTQKDDHVARFQPLFSYSYKSIVTEIDEFGDEQRVEKTFPTRFESEIEGVVVNWQIHEGSVIAGPDAALIEVEEPCRHEQQFGGMCAICGRDMTEVSYNTSTPDVDRAKINMVHGNTALLVSESEANRVDEEAKRRLLASRKLSLVVDLDQTIIHATVDPTVAEWQKDVNNANYAAVKDVRAFQLLDEGPGRGCWYYIKLRPGLQTFLSEISKFYELHIYTMGTRAYAANIAKIVDPDMKLFGDRILSRDESGSMTSKNLQRLFPTDTKMVVIIDDRGDVWNWTENLVKVTPYDFFVGIGDINSSFLPQRTEPANAAPVELPEEVSAVVKNEPDNTAENQPEAEEGQVLNVSAAERTLDPTQEQLEAVSVPETRPMEEQEQPALTNGTTSPSNGEHVSTLQQIAMMSTATTPAVLERQTTQQDETLNAQLTDRPLLQMQRQLDEAEERALVLSREQNGETSSSMSEPQTHRHNLLQDDDKVLESLEAALKSVHLAFFEEYDRRFAGSQGGRIAELRGEKSAKKRPHEDLLIVPDIKDIMPKMKYKVFEGLVFCFTGVVPLGTNIHYSDIGRWATSFGAQISDHVTPETTHVIATKQRRTAKVRAAAHLGAYIIGIEWLYECFTQWDRVDETPFTIHSDIHKETAIDTSAFDALTEEQIPISDDEGDASDSDQGDLRINIDDVMPTRALDGDSPVDELEKQDWADMWAEFNDIPDDEDESGETDYDSEASDRSQKALQAQKKRKRPETTDTTDAEESDNASQNDAKSRLQKRKKQALDRTTSLTEVITADKPSPFAMDVEGGAEDGGDDDEDDGFGSDVEREYEAELALGSDDDEDKGGA